MTREMNKGGREDVIAEAQHANSTLTLAEIAERINTRLKRIEWGGVNQDFRNAGCYYMGGRYLRITYRSHEGGQLLTLQMGLAYLDLLTRGFVGRHTERMKPCAVTTVELDGQRTHKVRRVLRDVRKLWTAGVVLIGTSVYSLLWDLPLDWRS